MRRLFFCVFIAITTCCWGQEDVAFGDTASLKDSVSVSLIDSVPVPLIDKVAALLSDSVPASVADSAVVKEKKHSPKLAGWLSVVPGLGQAYNKKYWKIPIDYVGHIAAGYCVYHFSSLYANYRDECRNRYNGDPSFEPNPRALYIRVFKMMNKKREPSFDPELSIDNIKGYRQSYQRNMQISIIALTLWYFINILDAVVDAHLMSFDVSNNLALQITPDFNTNPTLTKQTIGLSFTFNIKTIKTFHNFF